MDDKGKRHPNYGRLMAIAHLNDLPVAEYAARQVAEHGSYSAAGRANGVTYSAITAALSRKPQSRVIRLADAAGMDAVPWMLQQIECDGFDMSKTAARLKVSRGVVYKYVQNMPKWPRRKAPLPPLKRRQIERLLLDGFKPVDVAHLTGVSRGAVMHYARKVEALKRKMRTVYVVPALRRTEQSS